MLPSEQVPTHTSAHFTPVQLQRLQRYGTASDALQGEILYRPGDPTYDMILLESGSAEVVKDGDDGATVIATEAAGGFLGEMGLLSRQAVYLTGRMTSAGRIRRIDPVSLRRLMAEDAELSEILLTTFMARREELKASAALSLVLVGVERSAASLALKTFAARLQLPHRWLDADADDAAQVMAANGASRDELPVAVTSTGVLLRATPGTLSERLGLSFRLGQGSDEVDLVVVGAGPGGLAAAVYGASEGLNTALLDAVGPGGQAAASSRIENYLGFPNGLSGGDLIARAQIQALKFGASIYSPCEVTGIDSDGEFHTVALADGSIIRARAVIAATGARYRTLPLPRWADFEGAGIYYAATEIETRRLAGLPATVVGGANSAGQAAIFLASKGCAVEIVIRGADISAGMSSYLVDRIAADPMITVHTSTRVTALHGASFLTHLDFTDGSGAAVTHPAAALFCFIGAIPASEWLGEVARDSSGFVLTDSSIPDDSLSEAWEAANRRPLPFETSIPRIFAVGDLRHGSMKRVAAAVGEGASAVASTHAAIAAERITDKDNDK